VPLAGIGSGIDRLDSRPAGAVLGDTPQLRHLLINATLGTVIQPQPDDAPWRLGDAVLQLGGGPPRPDRMTLPPRGLGLSERARHGRVSQALGAIDGQAWFLVVARPDHHADRPFDPAADLQSLRIPPGRLVVRSAATGGVW
jgi:hypothetical protein